MTFSPPIAFSSASWPRASCSEVVGRFLGSLDWQGKLADSVSSPRSMVLTGAPGSPDFLSRLMASPRFMRLSVKKAAHAVSSRSRATGNPGSPKRTWAENDVFRMLSLHARELLLAPTAFCRRAEALEGAAPRLSRPMYAAANMGHPSREWASLFVQGPVVKTENR
jgi:hypothetical protein